MFDDNLTGMTGMDAPALDGGSAPVVRYQDLLRGSSPASAGAPSLATQRPYAPEVIEAAEEISEIGYGPSPLEVPSYVAPYYGGPQAGYGAPSAEEVMSTYPVLAKGDSGAKVKELQQLLVAAGAMTQQVMNSGPGTFGTQTEASVKAFQTVKHLPVSGAVSIDTWLALYGLTKPSQRTEAEASDAPTRGVKGTTGTDARGGAAKGAGSFLEAFNVGMGYKEDPKKKFEVSGKSNDSVGDGTDWGKVALWGGVAVAGIVATVLVVRAVRSKE